MRFPVLLACSLLMTICAAEDDDGHHSNARKPAEPPAHAALTLAEESSCHRIMDEALTLGFPELAGAVVTRGGIAPGWGPHLHLSDGSWLIDECIHRAASDVKASEYAILPPDFEPYMFRHMENLPPGERERMNHCLMRGSTFDFRENLGLTALAWWRTGVDADGQSLIAVVLRNSTTSQDHGDIFKFDDNWGNGSGLGVIPLTGIAPEVDIPTGMRRILSAWFRTQLAQAQTAEEADRWAASAMAITTPTDMAMVKPLVERLRTRFDLPRTINEHATLAERMMQWPGTVFDPISNAVVQSPAVPASRADTAELIALISDDRASRWMSETWIPRTVGDNALRALNRLWHIDWRDLTINDPTVIPKVQDLSTSSIWTDQLRHATSASLTRWWQAHGIEGEWAPLCGCIRNLPPWAYLYQLEALDQNHLPPVIGDCIAECLSQLPTSPSVDETALFDYHQYLSPILLMFPSHVGMTAFLQKLPQSRWTLGLQNVRAGLAGDNEGLQAWMIANLNGRGPVPENLDCPYNGDLGDPWGNLGLLAYRPTPSHLATLRTMLSWDLSRPGALWVLAHVGTMNYPVFCEYPLPQPWRHRPHAQAIPYALTLIGLRDTRALPDDARAALLRWAPENRGLYNPEMIHCAGARVCDWVASLLISKNYDQDFAGFVPVALRDDKRFVQEPVATRDADILHLQHALEPVLAHALSEAGMLTERGTLHLPSGADDF